VNILIFDDDELFNFDLKSQNIGMCSLTIFLKQESAKLREADKIHFNLSFLVLTVIKILEFTNFLPILRKMLAFSMILILFCILGWILETNVNYMDDLQQNGGF